MAENSEEDPGEVRMIQADGYTFLARIWVGSPYLTEPGAAAPEGCKYWGNCDFDTVKSIDEIKEAAAKPPILHDEVWI